MKIEKTNKKMYVAIKHYDIKNINNHFKWIDLENYPNDVEVIHNKHDLLVLKLNDEFGISTVGVSDNNNIIFEVIDDKKFLLSCVKFDLKYKVIGDDETVWIAKPKDIKQSTLLEEGLYLEQAVALIRQFKNRYIKDVNDLDNTSILGWHQNQLWFLDKNFNPISHQKTIFNGSIFKENKWSVFILE